MKIFFWLVVAPLVLIAMLLMPISAVAFVFAASVVGLWWLKNRSQGGST